MKRLKEASERIANWFQLDQFPPKKPIASHADRLASTTYELPILISYKSFCSLRVRTAFPFGGLWLQTIGALRVTRFAFINACVVAALLAWYAIAGISLGYQQHIQDLVGNTFAVWLPATLLVAGCVPNVWNRVSSISMRASRDYCQAMFSAVALAIGLMAWVRFVGHFVEDVHAATVLDVEPTVEPCCTITSETVDYVLLAGYFAYEVCTTKRMVHSNSAQ